MQMFLFFGNRVGSGYIISVVEGGGYFEDHFLETDGTRHLETRYGDGHNYSVLSIWVDSSISSNVPMGVDPTPLGEDLYGYRRYRTAITK